MSIEKPGLSKTQSKSPEKIKETSEKKDKSMIIALEAQDNNPIEANEEEEYEESIDEDITEHPENNDEETEASELEVYLESPEHFVFEPQETLSISEQKVVIEILKGKRFHCLKRFRRNYTFKSNSRIKTERMKTFGKTIKLVSSVIEGFMNGFYDFEEPSIEKLFNTFESNMFAENGSAAKTKRHHLTNYLIRTHEGTLIGLNSIVLSGRKPNDYYSDLSLVMLRIALGDEDAGPALKDRLREIAVDARGDIMSSFSMKRVIEETIEKAKKLFGKGLPEQLLYPEEVCKALKENQEFMRLLRELR